MLWAICRLCDAVGIAKLEGGIDVKLLQQKLEEVEAAIG